jgi:tRNA A37 methylthiotransferase MiaB
MTKLSILFFQLPHPLFPERNMPFSASFLISALNLQPNIKENAELSILPTQIMNYAGDAHLLNYIADKRPDCLAVSLYLWNSERSFNLLRQLKTKLPELILMLGGPEIYPEARLVLQNPFVDFFVFGEGEFPVIRLVQKILKGENDFENVPNIGFAINGKIVFSSTEIRNFAIEQLQLPYGSGLIDMDDYDSRMFFLYTMRGCPFACSYCSWSGRGKLRPFDKQGIFEELILILDFANRHQSNVYIFIMDSAFNFSPLFFDLCEFIADLNTDNRLEFGCFVEAEYITPKHAKALADANFTYVETGLQSHSNQVLKNVNRKLDHGKFEQGIKNLKAQNLFVVTDLILGLPQEDKNGFVTGVEYVKTLGIELNIFAFSLSDKKQIARHQIERQNQGPYYIQASASLPNRDLKSLYSKFNQNTVDFDFNARLSFDYPSENARPFDETTATDMSLFGIKSITLDCSLPLKLEHFPVKVLTNLAQFTRQKIIILAKGDFVFESEDFIQGFVSGIVKANPFSKICLLIEPSGTVPPKVFFEGLMALGNKIESVFLKNKNSLFPDKMRQLLADDFSVFLISSRPHSRSVNFPIHFIKKIKLCSKEDLEHFHADLKSSHCSNYLFEDPDNQIGNDFQNFAQAIHPFCFDNNLFFADAKLQDLWKRKKGVSVSLDRAIDLFIGHSV